MLSSHVPDLVVLDLGLPDMDGEEFIRVTRQSSLIPIIVLSARTDERDKVSALDLGANDYITKPFSTAELLARVRAALRSYRTASNGTVLKELPIPMVTSRPISVMIAMVRFIGRFYFLQLQPVLPQAHWKAAASWTPMQSF